MSRHRPTRDRIVPSVLRLEERDVPAAFYVDPSFAANVNGDVVTFNKNSPNFVTGRVVGTDAFATLTAALTKAAANAEADTIFLARSQAGGVPNVTPVDNTGGPILINDNITLIGSGAGATILGPMANTASAGTGVFEVAAGKSFTVQDLTFDGSGFQVGVGFRFGAAGVTGKVERVEVTNTAFGAVDGIGIGAFDGATLAVANSKVSSYGRIGISFADASGSVTGSTITGKGAGTTFINYGIQLAGNSHVVITGNTITGNTAQTGFFLSAGVNLFENAGAAPTATVTQNTITGNTFGARVGGNFGVDRSLASLHDNNLQANFLAIQADNVANVDATDNWFGDASGPYQITTNPNGKGSEITDQVVYQPFRTTPFVVTTTQVVVVPGPVKEKIVPAAVGTFAAGGSGNATVLTGNFVSVLGPQALGRFAGEVRVALADVTGDGTADLIAGAGPGGEPRVVVLDGRTGQFVLSFYAFDTRFTGGVFVAGGDVNGDGKADIVVGAGAGGNPHVKVFSGSDTSLLRSFYAYDTRFTGGVSVACGDVNGDGLADIITGAGAGGGSHVEVFSGTDNALRRSFYAYDKMFTGGIYVAAGDVNGDGVADIITGAGAGGGSHVEVFIGSPDNNPIPILLYSFYADTGTDRGIRVASEELDGDGRDDLIFGPAGGSDNRARVTYASALASGNPNPTAFSQPLFGTTGGLDVG